MNGALAIADVLGIYGREGVYAATYWRNPHVGSPGYFAFKMHGNYDGDGSRFGGRRCRADASDADRSVSYAALDRPSGVLRVMLINKDPDEAVAVGLDLAAFSAGERGPPLRLLAERPRSDRRRRRRRRCADRPAGVVDHRARAGAATMTQARREEHSWG